MKLIIFCVIILVINLAFVQAELNSLIIDWQEPSVEEKICDIVRGCFEDNKCYLPGHIKNEKYCSSDYILRFDDGTPRATLSGVFTNQSDEGESCIQNFECLTNICLEGRCINITKEISFQVNKQVEEMIKELSIQVNSQVKEVTKGITGSVVEESYKPNESEESSLGNGNIDSEKGSFGKFIDWIQSFFG